jgi:hypothetical protein
MQMAEGNMRLRRTGLVILLSGMAALLLALDCSREFSNREIAPTLRKRPADGRLGPLTSGRGGLLQSRGGADPNLVFDPVLVYSTFLGGPNGSSLLQGATVFFVDSVGNTYVAGNTPSTDFPVTPGVIGANPAYTFVSKIDPDGKGLIFSTYVPGLSEVNGLAVDTSGDVYVAGPSYADLPIPAGTTPFQASPRGIGIIKLNSTATTVLNATYLGGSGQDFLTGIALDPDGGSLYVTGITFSNDFPTKNPLQGSLGASGRNAFVTKLDSSLSTLVYSTYLGQDSDSGENTGFGFRTIAVDSSKNAYVIGTAGPGFPISSGAFQTTCSSLCAFLTKLNPSGSSLLYSTYLGEQSLASSVAVDSSQNSYVGGQAASGFSSTLSSCNQGYINGFVAEINAAGSLVFSTCLGGLAGNQFESGITDLVLDASGNIYVVGSGAAGLTLKNPIQANFPAVETDTSFVAAINPNTNSLLFSSLLGGAQTSEVESATGVGVDGNGNIYVAGVAWSGTGSTLPPPFPIFNAWQAVPGAGTCSRSPQCVNSDAFILKISPTDAPATALNPALVSFPAQAVGTSSTPQWVTIFDMGSAALTVSNATVTGDFSIQNNCTTVSPAGGTCTVDITFSPTNAATQNGTLTITDNSAGSPRTVQLVGQGAAAAATLSASSLSFPSQVVGTTGSAQGITLTNGGLLPLQVSHIQATGAFSETNTCGNSVGAGQSCAVSVTFTPTASGVASGTLTFTDSAPDSPQSVTLTGTGGNPTLALSVASGSSSSAKVTAGSSATYTLSIGGGGMGGTTSLSCTGAPMKATCSVPATESVSASAASNFNVSVTTAAPTQASVFSPGIATRPWPWAFAVFGIVGVVFLTKASSQRLVLRLLWAAPLFAILLCSCGGGGSQSQGLQNPGTPVGTYTLTVTATSGSTTQSQNLTLLVQ